MNEEISPKFIPDVKKAEKMAYAEDPFRTKAAIAKEAGAIVEEATNTGTFVQFINEAARKAQGMSEENSWTEQKQVRAADKALDAWDTGLERNATVLESKYAADFVADSAARSLRSEIKSHERSADKAGKIAGKEYDKRNQRQSTDERTAA